MPTDKVDRVFSSLTSVLVTFLAERMDTSPSSALREISPFAMKFCERKVISFSAWYDALPPTCVVPCFTIEEEMVFSVDSPFISTRPIETRAPSSLTKSSMAASPAVLTFLVKEYESSLSKTASSLISRPATMDRSPPTLLFVPTNVTSLVASIDRLPATFKFASWFVRLCFLCMS